MQPYKNNFVRNLTTFAFNLKVSIILYILDVWCDAIVLMFLCYFLLKGEDCLFQKERIRKNDNGLIVLKCSTDDFNANYR